MRIKPTASRRRRRSGAGAGAARLRARAAAHDTQPRRTLPCRDNALLASLPAAVLMRLRPHLELVALERSHVVLRAHEPPSAVWWPLTAVVSFVIRVEAGHTLEVGLVGREGYVAPPGYPLVSASSCDAIVQISGLALRVDPAIFKRELSASIPLVEATERFSHLLLVRSMQMSACHMFHSVEQRCARWLLTASDLTGHPEIPVTHELLATILGAHRPTVTQTLGSLDRAGLVAEERGRISLIDRPRLEAASCECYQVLRQEQQRLLGY